MANWFKSDISVYQRDEFRYYLRKCPALCPVWEWLQRYSVSAGTGTFTLSLAAKSSFCSDFKVSETDFKECLEILNELGLIDFYGPSIILRKGSNQDVV
jgi:hypothetical protein